MVWDGVYVPQRSRVDPEEAALMTDPRYFAAASRVEEEAKKKKSNASQPKQNKKHKREKDIKSQLTYVDVSALEEMIERIARRVYRECRKEDLMRETAYLLDMKG